MSEIGHPDIDPQLLPPISLERIFAEEAFYILAAQSHPETTAVGDMQVTVQASERYDIINKDPEAPEQALRLKSVPTFSGDGDAYSPSDKYYVIELQMGELREGMEPTDENYSWLPYVMSVVDTEDIDNISILNSKNGKDLRQGDLASALMSLQSMREEVRGVIFETISSTDKAPTYVTKRFKPFHSEEFYQSSFCGSCGALNTPCQHLPHTLS